MSVRKNNGAGRKDHEPGKVINGPEGVPAEWDIAEMLCFIRVFASSVKSLAPDPLIIYFS